MLLLLLLLLQAIHLRRRQADGVGMRQARLGIVHHEMRTKVGHGIDTPV